jgi:hypothetical protein
MMGDLVAGLGEIIGGRHTDQAGTQNGNLHCVLYVRSEGNLS